jgi:hypothetical protein
MILRPEAANRAKFVQGPMKFHFWEFAFVMQAFSESEGTVPHAHLAQFTMIQSLIAKQSVG